MKPLVLKSKNNKIIRFFNCDTNDVYLVYRKNKKRLDFCSSPDFFHKEPVLLVDQFKADEVQSRSVPGMDATIESYSGLEELRNQDILLASLFPEDSFPKILSGAVLLYACFLFIMFSFQVSDSGPRRQIAKQHIVELKKTPTATKVRKIQISSSQRNPSSVIKEKTETKVVKKSLKRMGALAVLGELSESESQQKSGLNLTGASVSEGPGFQALSGRGSGGVQSQIYSQGMISSALGSGGNIQGGGGHGTKGTHKGGGSAGYIIQDWKFPYQRSNHEEL